MFKRKQKVEVAVHKELPQGCGSHWGDHWCQGPRGHEGDYHTCAFCPASWPTAKLG